MIDSRAKGAAAETKVRDELRSLTKLQWERVPGSGALDPKHQLKGDLYVVGEKNNYVVEVKHYKEDHFTSAILTSKAPQIISWWMQACRQGQQVNKKPLLIFKHDRSKLFVAFEEVPSSNEMAYVWVNLPGNAFFVALLTDYIKHEKPQFICH